MERFVGRVNVKTILLILVVIELAIILSLAWNYLKYANFVQGTAFGTGSPSLKFRASETYSIKSGDRYANTADVTYRKIGRIKQNPDNVPQFWNYTRDLPEPEDSEIPRIVHQVLTNNVLTFRNYLSILSVHKVLRPYRIILYVPKSFSIKQYTYHRWFQKATSDIPFLEVVYSAEIEGFVGHFNTTEELKFAASVLNKVGGVYVNLNTVINWNPWIKKEDIFQIGFSGNRTLGFMLVPRRYSIADYLQKFTSSVGENQNKNVCATKESFSGSEYCCVIQQNLFPVDIMHDMSPLAAFARFLYYGTSDILQPQNSFPPIPKIVHYVWFGHTNISFSMYVSFRSTLQFVKPLKIIIYVDRYNLGSYFDEMRKFSVVTVVNYGFPKTVFQKRITSSEHACDYVRTDVLLRFGGIYLDWDVYWLKPVDELLQQGFETIAAFEHYNGMTPREEFPDTINTGVVLARPGSRFISLWQDSLREYTGEHATFHTIEMVYKLYEEHPDLLHIEKTLQVMCFKLKCHPLWLSNYKDTNVHNEFDYTDTAFAVHFTDPVPIGFLSEEDMKRAKGYFADMARHAYGVTLLL